jgi:hypothetical protein
MGRKSDGAPPHSLLPNVMEATKMKRKVYTAMLFSTVMFSTFPVEAVSYHSRWFADRAFTPGTTTKVTSATTASHFCFLTEVSTVETDTNRESATCRLTRDGLVWVLEAILGTGSSDAQVQCRATCYRN